MEIVMLTALFFFLNIDLSIQDLLWPHINLRAVCSISMRNAIGILTD